MKAKNNDIPKGIPPFLSKLLEEKKAIKEAISEKKPMSTLSKEKGIHFANFMKLNHLMMD